MNNIIKDIDPDQLKKFEIIKTIGKGGYGIVFLAKLRKDDNSDKLLIALKIMDCSQRLEQRHYAHREIAILRHLNHDNIVSFVDSCESKNQVGMAMSFVKGPTLERILTTGGSPSIIFCHVIMAQLINAVSYLHSKAVIHRDIKPENLIIVGAQINNNNDIWDNNYEETKKNKKNGKHNDDYFDSIPWNTMNQKWKTTLIDFGFARALTKSDLLPNDNGESKKNTTMMLSNEQAQHDVIAMPNDSSSSKCQAQIIMDQSVSRTLVRDLSAIGTRNYAAPEVVYAAHDNNKAKQKNVKNEHEILMETLSSVVSDYGMLADAYSVGSSCRYLWTGAPPGQSVQELLSAQRNPLAKAARWIIQRKASPKQQQRKKKKNYRLISSLPTNVIQLIRGLTHNKTEQRMSVRTARLDPMIDSILHHQDNKNKNDMTISSSSLSSSQGGEIMKKKDSVEFLSLLE